MSTRGIDLEASSASYHRTRQLNLGLANAFEPSDKSNGDSLGRHDNAGRTIGRDILLQKETVTGDRLDERPAWANWHNPVRSRLKVEAHEELPFGLNYRVNYRHLAKRTEFPIPYFNIRLDVF